MPLGMEVGLGPGDFVLDGDPAPSPKRGRSPLPNYRPIAVVAPNGWMHQDATWYGGRPQPRGLCVGREPSLPLQKGDGAAQIFGACLLWPNAWMDQDGTWHVSRPRPRRHCVRWGPISPCPKTGGALPYSPIFAPCLLWPNGWMDQDGTWNKSDAKNQIRLYTA